ncbi:MAG: hypothetical protein LBM97_02235 [Candidatus Nomurabacteria bacterium]|jgi:orotate phosphoribosyltransferase|nr:hypothetical protein [Candidatus Nomurabacteria bacterium]
MSILQTLKDRGAIITDSHLVLTSGKHSSGYVNMRAIAHDVNLLQNIGNQLAMTLQELNPQVIIGPETLGRTLASFTAATLNKVTRGGKIPAIWCEMGEKEASFSPKLAFDQLVKSQSVAIVDDLLTTGISIRKVVDLVEQHGCTVICAAVVVQRDAVVTAADCNVPQLFALETITGGIPTFDAASCPLCDAEAPMLLRPGHGHEWIKTHPDYTVAV